MTCEHDDQPKHAHGLCRGCYDEAPQGPSARAGYRALPTAATFVAIPVIVRDYSDLEKLHLDPLGDVHKGASTTPKACGGAGWTTSSTRLTLRCWGPATS